MQQILSSINPDSGPSFVTAYIDDLLVFSSTLSKHLDHLRLVLEKLKDVGLKLNPNKCCYICKEVEYLGHIITPCGLQPNGKLIAAVKEYIPPNNVQELRRFLVLASYYRRFVPQFVRIAHPLHQQTCKGIEFIWSKECEAAFQYRPVDEDFYVEKNGTKIHLIPLDVEFSAEQHIQNPLKSPLGNFLYSLSSICSQM